MGISHLGGDIEINLTNMTKVTKNLQEKLDLVLRIFREYPDEALGEDTVLNLLEDLLGIGEEEGRALLKILVQDGSIFQPRPGFYKLSGGG